MTTVIWLAGAGMAATAPEIRQEATSACVSIARGRALFTGSRSLTGRIREHKENMPPAVVTCGNCHATGNQSALSGTDAPVLRASWLTERRVRRNGPVSAYDSANFCRVLRTGLDPVLILVDHAMPVYALSDADCLSLWMFLQAPEAK